MTDFATIKAAVDCRALLVSYGVRFAPGATGNAHCWNDANHANGDRSASVQVFADGFKCHGACGSGDVFDVVQYFEGCGRAEARQMLAERAGIDSPGQRPRTAQRRNAAAKQAPPTQRPAAEIPAVRREVLGRVWDCLAFADQPAALFEFGAVRGVSEHTMRLTVRDWTAVAAAVVGVIRDGFTRADLTAAGVLKSDGTPWHPFAELREIAAGTRAAASGFVVPVFDGESSAPVAMRWRYYNPHGRVKALAQPSGAPVLPIGLDTIERARADGTPYIVVLCEGETDWLATIDAAQAAGINAAVLSHCVMSTPWRAEWTAMMHDAAAVVVGFDEGNTPTNRETGKPEPDKRPGVRRAREIASQLGKAWIDRTTMKLTREGARDFADLHKNGELAPLLNVWTTTAAQTTHTLQNKVSTP